MKKSGINQRNIYETFNPDNYLSSGITREQILELKDAFDLLDTNAQGKIDPTEFKNILKAYGIDQRNLSLEIVFTEATANNKPVDFSQFLQIFTAYFYSPKTKETMKKVFRLFDDENMGCITAKNLRRVIKQLDLQIQESEIQQMIDRADGNNDGVVSQDEFYQIMTHISSKI